MSDCLLLVKGNSATHTQKNKKNKQKKTVLPGLVFMPS